MTHLPIYFQAREEIHQRLNWQQPQHQQQTTACHSSVSGVSKEKHSPSTTQAKSCERQSKVCDKGHYPFTQSEHRFCSLWPKKARTVCAKASCHSIRNFWRYVSFRNLNFFLRLLGKYLPQVQYKVDLHLGFFVLQFLCLGCLKRQQTSDGLRFLHRSCIRTKRNGGLLLREKQIWQLSTRLNKPLTAQRRGHRLIETSNH